MNNIFDSIDRWLLNFEISSFQLKIFSTFIVLAGFQIILYALWLFIRRFLLNIIARASKSTKTKWDEYLVEEKFFSMISNLGPLFLFDYYVDSLFYKFPDIGFFISKIVEVLMLVVTMVAINRGLSAVHRVLSASNTLRDKPLKSYFQLSKILSSGVFIILILSIATDKNPLYFFTGLGAVSAILLLIFKDTILGFVSSIQLAANDMIRIGDWVSVEKYGADGDVIEITLATVKVQNWDKTITTIPTYAFISDSFKNWRGMQESGGRRIKRSIFIKMDSIQFCDSKMIEKYSKFQLIGSYILQRELEINKYNEEKKIDKSMLINGRHQTNIGLFRRYVYEYLNDHPLINTSMTIMVRQLQPTALGLPLEIYCFSSDKTWVNYESIQSDLFDHILAALPFFDLELFESPTGKDFKGNFPKKNYLTTPK
jgi:miniconductance mechanosensitive channel